jgi:tetratricopeptide (TPR) repeat protein
MFLAMITALSLWQIRRRPYLAVGWFWFLGTLVPVIGLVQVGEQAMADRFSYVPHIGLFLALVWGVADWFQGRGLTVFAWGAAAVLACLGVVAYFQQGSWRNTRTLWEHAIAVTTDNARAHANLGLLLLQQGDRKGAIRHLTRSVEIDGRYAENHYNLGLAWLREGDARQAAEHFAAAVALKPTFADAQFNLGLAWLRLGEPRRAVGPLCEALHLQPASADTHAELGKARWELGDPAAAMKEYETALALRADYPEAHNNLGRLLLRQGDLDQALDHFRKAVQVDPAFADPYNNIGVALGRRGDWIGAVEQFRTACRLQPKVVPYRCNLAYALTNQGEAELGRNEYAGASALDPDWCQAARTSAWKLATDPDPGRRNPALALELASQACQATGYRHAEDLDALAASQAAAGHFREAAATADKARALAEAAGQASLASRISNRMSLYRRGRPFRADAGRSLPRPG